MQRKYRIIISEQQKLEYAKMMVEEGYSNQQMQEISGACSSAVVRWKRQYKAEKQGITPQNQKALTPEQKRIQELEKQSDAQLRHQIRVIASESNHTYGKRRIREELKEQGVSISLYKVAKLKNRFNIYVRHPKRKHYYPDYEDEKWYAPHLLNRQFTPEICNTHWVTDVTYIRSHQGWSYLACILGLVTKEVVGYALSPSPDTKLTLAALNQAIINKKPKTSALMVHSDQGCHFSSYAYRNRLKALNIRQSMSRRGNCWDNSVMERFFRTLKSEHLNTLSFTNHQ